MKIDKPLNNSCYAHGQKKPAIARAMLSVIFGFMRNNTADITRNNNRYFANSNRLYYLTQIKINKNLIKYKKEYWNAHIKECLNGKIDLSANIDVDEYQQFKAELCGSYTWFRIIIRQMIAHGLLVRQEETFFDTKKELITRRVWAIKALDKMRSFGSNFREIKEWFKKLFYSIFNSHFAKGSKRYLKTHFGDQFLSQMEPAENELLDLDWLIT